MVMFNKAHMCVTVMYPQYNVSSCYCTYHILAVLVVINLDSNTVLNSPESENCLTVYAFHPAFFPFLFSAYAK